VVSAWSVALDGRSIKMSPTATSTFPDALAHARPGSRRPADPLPVRRSLMIEELELPEVREQANAMSCD
jgi:hypothetical protein